MSEPILTEEAKRDLEAAMLAWKIDVPDCIRAWKGQPAEVQNEH